MSEDSSHNTRSGQVPKVLKHYKVSNLANSTSYFRKADVNMLNVEYESVSFPTEIVRQVFSVGTKRVPKEMYISNMSSVEIMSILTKPHEFDKLERNVKTFVQLVSDIIENETFVRGTEESKTSALVNHIFTKLEFGEYPLKINPQPMFSFNVHTHKVSSKLDYAIMKERSIMLVDEDKHIRNTGPPYAWGEYQIAGELIASAYTNFLLAPRLYKSTLYGVRVIGLKFTFYKATITSEYLTSLGEGFPDLPVHILRYPPESSDKDFPYLDYGNVDERKRIIDILTEIRSEITTT